MSPRPADDLPLVRIFLPSLLERARAERGAYAYRVYLGFDADDPVFDDPAGRAAVAGRLAALVRGAPAPVEFVWYRYEGMEGKVFWIYNDLFRQAARTHT
jgi:hypothetical protein